jgi:hypothetical protein
MRPIIAPPLLWALCTILLAGAPGRAIAVDGVYAHFGGGQSVGVYGVGLSWAPWTTLPLANDMSLSLRGVAGVAVWDARDGVPNQSLIDISVYPVLRLDAPPFGPVVPYVEGSVGVNLLTHTWIGDRQMSTAFQFGEFAGVGIAFGDKRQFDVGVRYQHVSNADIKKPNPGLTFGSIVFQYRFDSR